MIDWIDDLRLRSEKPIKFRRNEETWEFILKITSKLQFHLFFFKELGDGDTFYF